MRSARVLRALSLLALASVTLAVILVPAPALAWGPLAHLNFSAQALANLSVAQPSVRGLLQDFGNEFLYGSLAADIVVGKNLARFVYHCHNWRVGFSVLKQARDPSEKAFSLGFLAHLSADTVAHNYFVPYKTVYSFHKARTRHAYWELRYDQQMDVALSRLARRVSARPYRGHDEFLQRALGPASVLPFAVSKQLFGSLLASARTERFQGFSRLALARERSLVLEPDLVSDTDDLAVHAILGLLAEGERCRAATADATGARNIRMAQELRKNLKLRAGRPGLPAADAHLIAAETRESFRRAIHGKLILPASLARLAA
ncbi:MAG TPA: zinc dependent phospholipase C family protein [Anaeromyxobacteraceae bacterium]|jgi:hypothetical protein|nr:zinc dependent phospholipase C family protein [Anaeromyxobacteraceae bacterium]